MSSVAGSLVWPWPARRTTMAIPALVLERLDSPPDLGLAINLPGNAVQALSALRTVDDLARLGLPIRRRECRNARGRLLFSANESEFWGETPGRDTYAVRISSIGWGAACPPVPFNTDAR